MQHKVNVKPHPTLLLRESWSTVKSFRQTLALFPGVQWDEFTGICYLSAKSHTIYVLERVKDPLIGVAYKLFRLEDVV